MHLNSPALVLDVPDPDASRDFLTEHLGFSVAATGDGFTALAHEDHGLRIIVRPLAPGATQPDYTGLQIGFLVTGIDDHWVRLKEPAAVIEPIQTSAAVGERSFQIADPNGIPIRVIQLLG
jgi:catechol 2,3-dioxygenase-like lactoylglutathione lyase family enzyme